MKESKNILYRNVVNCTEQISLQPKICENCCISLEWEPKYVDKFSELRDVTFSLLMTTLEAFVDRVDQDQTVWQSDLWSTLSTYSF